MTFKSGAACSFLSNHEHWIVIELPGSIITICSSSCVVQSRGSTRDGTGVHDSIVNQLLTKVSKGVEYIYIFFIKKEKMFLQ